MAGQGSAGNVIAAVCSFFVPGLGQLVQGRLLMAILQFALAVILSRRHSMVLPAGLGDSPLVNSGRRAVEAARPGILITILGPAERRFRTLRQRSIVPLNGCRLSRR